MRSIIQYSILKKVGILIFGYSFSVQFIHAQWISQTSNSIDNLLDVVMLDTMQAIAIGDRNAILRTNDAGVTWTNQTIAISAIYSWKNISFFDSQNGAIVGDNRLITTTDGGQHWQFRTLPENAQNYLSVLHTGPASMFVGSDSGLVYWSSDTGQTWTSEKVSDWPICKLFEWRGPIILDAPNYYALTPYMLYSKPIYPSQQWNEISISHFRALGSAAFDGEFSIGSGTVFIVGVYGDLWSQPAIIRKSITDDAWYNLPTGIMGAGPLLGISAPSANIVYVCGTNGRIFKTSDSGNTWRSHTLPTLRNIRAINFYDEKHGFAVGDSGTILNTLNGGEVPVDIVENENRLSSFLLLQNYPNPFNPETKIDYEIQDKRMVKLAIYDLLGREVTVLVDEMKPAGRYSVKWNGLRFGSGVYFYSLKAGEYSSVKKLLLLK